MHGQAFKIFLNASYHVYTHTMLLIKLFSLINVFWKCRKIYHRMVLWLSRMSGPGMNELEWWNVILE